MRTKHVVIFLYLNLIVVVFSAYFGLGLRQSENPYLSLVDQQVEFLGQIVSAPEINNSGSQIIIVKPDEFEQSIRVGLFRPSYYKDGDRVLIRGKIKLPENFSSFNYIRFLQMKGVYAELRSPEILVLWSGQSTWRNLLYKTKSMVTRAIRKVFPLDQSGLILGMLVGEAGDLSIDLSGAYSRVGLTHILVVSGYNLTIIASSLSFFSKSAGRSTALLISLFGVWFFVFLTGATSGVVRAGIMATIFLLARRYGRLNSSFYALLLAVVLIVYNNPLRLLYDIGLQLSVLATYGVLAVYRIQYNFQIEQKIFELIFPTAGAIVFTLPVIGYYFGTLSIVAPLVNTIVLPFVPLEMFLGILGLLPIISEFTNYLLGVMLNLQNWFVVYMANLSWAQISWKPSLLFVFGYYFVILCFEKFLIWRSKLRLKNTLDSGTITEIII